MYAVLLHAHQKIDRVAYRHLRSLLVAPVFFPELDSILHFEGRNGPDAAKLKKQVGHNQPWHFINPFDDADTDLYHHIDDHYQALVTALVARDEVRAGFEAAWLAHALVDGLTPAHHYPYEQTLENLRGQSRHSRKGLMGRAFIRGETRRDSMRRSLKLIGPKGLLTTHAMFEGGAYTIMAPLRLTKAMPSAAEVKQMVDEGVTAYFRRLAREIAALGMYERFYDKGWTAKLSRDIRRELAPRMVQIVTLAWYAAAADAERRRQRATKP